MSVILEVQNAEKYYGNKGNISAALNDLSFTVSEGEFVGIMGASGSGKTTLLNCISTIDTLSAGRVLIRDKNIADLKGKELDRFRAECLGFIFQDFNLLDTMTARENIALALSVRGEDHSKIDDKIGDIAKLLGIEDVLDKFPYEMSGGQSSVLPPQGPLLRIPSLFLPMNPPAHLIRDLQRH